MSRFGIHAGRCSVRNGGSSHWVRHTVGSPGDRARVSTKRVAIDIELDVTPKRSENVEGIVRLYEGGAMTSFGV